MWRRPFTSKISPAAAMVKPTPPSAMRVSMSKPTHQPQGYAWLMLAMVAMPVAKRTTVVTTAAMTRSHRIASTCHGQRGRAAAARSVVAMLLVLVVGPEPEAPLHDHGDDGHRDPHRPEDLRREVQQLARDDGRRLRGQVGGVAQLLDRDGREMQDRGATHLLETVDVRDVVVGRARDAAPRL